jgi:hypothetical protein
VVCFFLSACSNIHVEDERELRVMPPTAPKAMANYFRNQPKPLSEFFDLADGDRLEIVAESLARMAKTFHTHMGSWPGPIRFVGLFRRELPKGHHLRVYEDGTSGGAELSNGTLV